MSIVSTRARASWLLGFVLASALSLATSAQAAPSFTLGTPTFTQIAGNGDANIDPGEDWSFAFVLNNVGDETATAVVAQLTSSSLNIQTYLPSTTVPDVTAGGSAPGATPLRFALTGQPCGSSLGLQLNVVFNAVSGAGSISIPIARNAGALGAPVTFTSATVVPIADGAGAEVPGTEALSTVAVSGLSTSLADVDFSFNGSTCTNTAGATTVGLDHTFVGDLRLRLQSPGGTSVFIVNRVSNGGGGNSGNNFCQTVLDDAAGAPIQAVLAASAPFTGSFQPANPLSAFNGEDPNGTWTLGAQDFFVGDTGNIRSFSVRITSPVCAAAAGTVALSATKTVAGALTNGSTVTYTVTLTNTGTRTQLDNAGHEFTDNLPASINAPSATASSGTATLVGNTVRWNGAVEPGVPVTITIQGTIGAAPGTLISNQGTLSFDANRDGTNESTAATDDPGTPTANDATNFTVQGLPQTITFGANPGPLTLGTVGASVSASASSSLAVTFTSTTPGVCAVGSGTGALTLLTVGSCIIAADQPGDATFAPAPQVTQTVVIGQATQTITFGANPGPLTFGTVGASVSASASSLLAVSYSSTTPTVCAVDANTGVLTLITTGNCIIAANQPGDATFAPAPQVTQTVVIGQATQTITFGANPGPITIGTATASVSATASSGLAVTFASDTPAICTVNPTSGLITTITVGGCQISAFQSGNANYLAAPSVSQIVTIVSATQAPLVLTATPTTLTVGSNATLNTTGGSGTGAVTYAVTTGATNCSVTGNLVTALAPGSCTITATKAGDGTFGPATATVTLQVGALTAVPVNGGLALLSLIAMMLGLGAWWHASRARA